jgi:ankyrin repeat protein
MVQLLERAGSDIYQQNKDGLSCLHLSAQGGSPFMMVRLWPSGSITSWAKA